MEVDKKAEIERKFQALQKIEDFLSKNVTGYLGKTQEFDDYQSYNQSHGGDFSISERLRVSDTIKMYKAMVMFQKEHGELPTVDMFSGQGWEQQLKGQSLLAENNIDMALFGDIEDGQIMIHNKVSNAHSVVGFDFVFDKEDKFGHIQLSQEGKSMFPKLESALRGMLLINGTHEGSLEKSNVTDHLRVDSSWMMSNLSNLTKGHEIIQEVAASTGPKSMSIERSNPVNERSYESESFGMSR